MNNEQKAKLRDDRKTGAFKKMSRPAPAIRDRVEAKKGGKMNAGLKAYLAKKKKKKGKK